MARPSNDGNSKLWRTKADLLGIFDCGTSHFENSIKPLIAEQFIRRPTKRGRPILYKARAVLDAWAEARKPAHRPSRKPGRQAAQSPVDPDDALLLAAGDSPGLERMRLARAELYEMQVRQRRGELIETAEFRDVWAIVSRVLREAGERLQRDFGRPAFEMYDEAVDDAIHAVEQYLDRQEEEPRDTVATSS